MEKFREGRRAKVNKLVQQLEFFGSYLDEGVEVTVSSADP